MVFLDKKLFYETGVKIYRFKNYKGLNILAEESRNTNDQYEVCDTFICKQNNKYYIFGSGRNTSWVGYELEKYKGNENIIKLFERYEYINS